MELSAKIHGKALRWSRSRAFRFVCFIIRDRILSVHPIWGNAWLFTVIDVVRTDSGLHQMGKIFPRVQ